MQASFIPVFTILLSSSPQISQGLGYAFIGRMIQFINGIITVAAAATIIIKGIIVVAAAATAVMREGEDREGRGRGGAAA